MAEAVNRFARRKMTNDWAVWDAITDAPAVVEAREMVNITMADADDMVDLLNHLEREKDASSIH